MLPVIAGMRHFVGAVFLGTFAAAPAAGQEFELRAPGTGADLRDALRVASAVLDSDRRDARDVTSLLAAARADYARLTAVLYAEARYGGRVRVLIDGREAADIPPLDPPERIERVAVVVEPGPAFAFSRARIAPLAPGTTPPAGFAVGRPARSPVIRDAAEAGVRGWRKQGHAKAEVAGQRIVARHGDRTVAATIRLDPGPRLRFGELAVTGNRDVRTRRIVEIAGLPTGEVFSPAALERAADRLRRAGVFRSVALREEATPAPSGRLGVTANVAEEKPRRIGFGAELNSLEGVSVSGFWLHRNLLGGAERLRLSGEASGIAGDSGGIDSRFSARFDRPATFGADTGLFLEADLARLDEPDFTSNSADIGGGFSRIFSPRLRGEAALFLGFSDVSDDFGQRDFGLLRLPLSATRDGRDTALDATAGTYLSAEVTPYLGLGEAESGARLFLDGRAYRGLDAGAGDGIVFAGRVQAGAVLGSALDATRPGLLFFSGGAGTVRGQPYQSLAVDLAGGVRVGGRAFLGLSGEVRAGVTERIGLVGFVDAGAVGRDSVPGSGDWHAGAGLGVRYDTGVGPIRFDLAAPVGGDTGEGAQLYLGIGQAF